MSTKTTFKRIALGLVAAMGFGMLSVAPASATDLDITAATGFTFGGSATAATITTTAGANNFVAFNLATTNGSQYALAVTGSTASNASTDITGSGTAALIIQATTTTYKFVVPTTAEATIVVKSYAYTAGVKSSTATSTLTITVNPATTGVGAISVGNSSSYITDSATIGGITSFVSTPNVSVADVATAWGALTADTTTAKTKGSAGTVAGAYLIAGKLKDSQVPTAAAMTGKTLVATVTGPGLLTGAAADAAIGTTPARAATTVTNSTSGIFGFLLYSDGTAGVSTVTITYTDSANVTTTVATESVTFFGSAATFTATVKTKYIANTGTAWPTNATDPAGTLGSTRYAVMVVVKDSAGNPVGGVTPSVKTSTADSIYITSGTCTSSTATSGKSYCELTAASGAADANVKVTFYTGTVAAFTYVSADVDVVVVSRKAATFTVTAEASVNQGQVITYTITAKDAAGNPVADGTLVTDYLYASPTIAGGALTDFSNVDNANALSALFTAVKFYNGVATDTVQAPFAKTTISAIFDNNGAGLATSAGSYFATTALRNAEVIVTTSVVADQAAIDAANAAGDAAAEATDAANAATDAANAAAEAADAATAAAQDAADAVAALSAQVASLVSGLKAQLTALTNLVIKIQKKVKA